MSKGSATPQRPAGRPAGPTILTGNEAQQRAQRSARRRSPNVSLVVACSQRKRIAPAPDLRLGSLRDDGEPRVEEWIRRLEGVDGPRLRAQDLYAGDHWQAALTAYQFTLRYTGRAELWVISAGVGLVAGTKLLRSYSATFASGSPDSVWRGPGDGDRQARLREWWRALPHDGTLSDLLVRDGFVVVAAGAAYVDALRDDLDALHQQDGTGERVSVISAGSRGNGWLLPASGHMRGIAGGTDGALNARLLGLLAEGAEGHGFRHSEMGAALVRAAARVPATARSAGITASDDEVARHIRRMRRGSRSLSRTQALHQLRAARVACEQSRFASIWDRVIAESR